MQLKTNTIQNLGVMLDVLALNQRVISQNIAHANTPDYIPYRLDFNQVFEQLQQSQGLQANQKPELVFHLQKDALGKPVKVELDSEMAALAENAVQFQTLLKAVNRQYTILSMAVNDGKK